MSQLHAQFAEDGCVVQLCVSTLCNNNVQLLGLRLQPVLI